MDRADNLLTVKVAVNLNIARLSLFPARAKKTEANSLYTAHMKDPIHSVQPLSVNKKWSVVYAVTSWGATTLEQLLDLW